jgi:galactose-1-phosphate uridylyltransferase
MRGMFSVREVITGRGLLQFRTEHFSGIRCRISPDRLKRQIDRSLNLPMDTPDCPFCPDTILTATPTFPDGKRIVRGESVTFPNMFPFSECHVVTVMTREHSVTHFSRKQVADALLSQCEALSRRDGYASINWNYLPSSGASILHPHMQGLSDTYPSRIADLYIGAGEKFRKARGRIYWDAVREQERDSDRYLFGDEILWTAHAVPIGEREVRGLLPISTLEEMENYSDLLARGILEVIALYRKLGTYAFNMAVIFDKNGSDRGFRAFCSMISRINPNPSSTSDSAFMERLHLEPVIMTLPEDLGRFYKKEKNG